jgi:hypothetical protein
MVVHDPPNEICTDAADIALGVHRVLRAGVSFENFNAAIQRLFCATYAVRSKKGDDGP